MKTQNEVQKAESVKKNSSLILYDSYFGHTKKVAQTIGVILRGKYEVQIKHVRKATLADLSNLDLLVVGSPTRGFRPTEPITKFIDGLKPNTLKGIKVTAFDTRIALEDVPNWFLRTMMRKFGYAAKPLAERLLKKGGELVAPVIGVNVTGTEGPLKEGELEKVKSWAEKL